MDEEQRSETKLVMKIILICFLSGYAALVMMRDIRSSRTSWSYELVRNLDIMLESIVRTFEVQYYCNPSKTLELG